VNIRFLNWNILLTLKWFKTDFMFFFQIWGGENLGKYFCRINLVNNVALSIRFYCREDCIMQ